MSKSEVLSAKEFSDAVRNTEELEGERATISLAEGLYNRVTQKIQYGNYVSSLLRSKGRTANPKKRNYASQTARKA